MEKYHLTGFPQRLESLENENSHVVLKLPPSIFVSIKRKSEINIFLSISGNTDKHYLTEKLMGKIGERLPGEWEKLGIYLGVSRVNLDRIRGDNRNKVEAWALDMFRMWYSRNSTHPSRWQDLQRALGEVYRNDLIDFTREYFLQNGSKLPCLICYFLFQGPHCTGKVGKLRKKNRCQGKQY